MIHSMTGFGEARLEQEGRTYHLEIRSVNNRYLKTSLHLPEPFAGFETELERVLRQRLTRGSVTLRLHVRELTPQTALQIDTSVLHAYLDRLRTAAGDDPRSTIDLATLLTLPGVTQVPDITEEERAENWKLLESLANAAIDKLIAMRRIEGQALAADLKQHCAQIDASLAVVRERAPLVVQEYRDRLHSRVQELLSDSGLQLGADDLLKEVSIYAERSDIAEEVQRLAGHVEQFMILMNAEGASGRKLEFVAQEMLREANTIGSKTGDATIARQIIEAKSAIDRIKEQVLNAE